MYPWAARIWRRLGRPVDESYEVQFDWTKDHLGRLFLVTFTWWTLMWLPILVIVDQSPARGAGIALASALLVGGGTCFISWMLPYRTSLTAAELRAIDRRTRQRHSKALRFVLRLALVFFAASAVVYTVAGRPLEVIAALLASTSAFLGLRYVQHGRPRSRV